MTVGKCMYCGGFVSDKAMTCPHCGGPIESIQEESSEVVNPELEALEARKKQVNVFMTVNAKKLPYYRYADITKTLMSVSDSQFNSIMSIVKFRNPTNMFWLVFFLGGWGIHYFLTGHAGWGVIRILFAIVSSIIIGSINNSYYYSSDYMSVMVMFYMITIIWFIVDLCIIYDLTRNYNYKRLSRIIR